MDGTFKKVFYNIGFVLFRTLYQYLVNAVDSKHLLMKSENGKYLPIVQVLKMAVRAHLKRTGFATFVNDLAFFAKDGTTYVKMVDDHPEIVSNLNLVAPEYEPDIQKTGCAEKLLYSYEEMQSRRSEWGEEIWAKVQDIWQVMREKGEKDFVVYEFWNLFDFGTEDKPDYHKGCKLFLDNSLTEPQDRKRTPQPTEWEPYLLLDKYKTTHKRLRKSKRLAKKLGKWEELYPYKPLTFIDVPKRRIGFSIFELISGIQEAYNRKMNLHDKKDILDLMGIFKHKRGRKNASVTQQLLQNIQSGTVVELETDEELERLVIDTKTGELIANIDKLFELAKQLTGITSQGIGEEEPASMPATNAVINRQAQQTTYDYAVEKIGIFLKEFFEDFYMPVIIDELTQQELIEIVGDPAELNELDEMFITEQLNQDAEKYKAQFGRYPSEEEFEAERQRLMSEQNKLGDTRFAELKKKLISKISTYLEFYVNNESFDANVKIKNLIALKSSETFTGSHEKVDDAIFDLLNENPKLFKKSPEEAAREIENLRARAMVDQGVMPNAAPIDNVQMGQDFGLANQA